MLGNGVHGGRHGERVDCGEAADDHHPSRIGLKATRHRENGAE